MGFITTIIIALGLAMDAFAVSIVSGTTYKKLEIRHAFRIAAFFGGFQAVMPLIGALAALSVKGYIANYDHWIAFGLLIAVGVKMIYESFKMRRSAKVFDPSNIVILLVLSVATSIDALAMGVTLTLLKTPVMLAVIIIGLVTFVLSYMGVFIGKNFGSLFPDKIEAIGGLVLIGLGLKILAEHMV